MPLLLLNKAINLFLKVSLLSAFKVLMCIVFLLAIIYSNFGLSEAQQKRIQIANAKLREWKRIKDSVGEASVAPTDLNANGFFILISNFGLSEAQQKRI